MKGKVALVTGSTRGIGKATALELAKKGAKIILNSANSSKEGKELEKELTAAGTKCKYYQCDISDEQAVKEMIAKGIKEFGQIDILVNNAGIVFDIPFFEKKTQHWQKTLSVNIMGTMFCCREVAKHMKEKKIKGAIINVSSTNSTNCSHPDSIDYDISKAGINLLTKDLAMELAPNIRVNAIAPGWVDTEMNADLPEEFIEEEKKNIFLKRFAEPEEMAKVIVFLASEDASFITGSIITTDGGHS